MRFEFGNFHNIYVKFYIQIRTSKIRKISKEVKNFWKKRYVVELD